jgi:hypothetical protein
MFENLMGSLGGSNELLNGLKEKFGLSAEQAEKVLPVAQDSVTETLKEQVLSGNLGGVSSLLGTSTTEQSANPLSSAISNNMLQGLISKVGLPEGIASKISVDFLPQILDFFQSKAKDENGNISESGIMGLFGGGLGDMLGGLKNKLGGFF